MAGLHSLPNIEKIAQTRQSVFELAKRGIDFRGPQASGI